MKKGFSKLTQKLLFKGTFIDDAYEDYSNVRSYTTFVNHKKPVCDNIYGHLVVADFNFDGREDFALIRDSGGNGGSLYNFYLQDDNCHFAYNKYLSSRMMYFPKEINKSKKTLTTYVHAGVCCVGKDVYRLDMISGNWKHISYKLLGY